MLGWNAKMARSIGFRPCGVRSFVGAVGLAAFCACMFGAGAAAQAHFILQSPGTWWTQDASGLPEKLGPCGNEGGGSATGVVTPFKPGDQVAVTVNEVIFHPGHYRIALSVSDRSELPAEPLVTATATDPCGSVPSQSPAVFPVLADDVFDHTAPFTMPQTFMLTLPTDVTCSKCTLQVIEFMSDHPLNNPGGCFYHHCADISIGATVDGGGSSQAGTSGTDGSVGGIGGSGAANKSGCSCAMTDSGAAGLGDPALVAGLLSMLLLSRVRSARSKRVRGI